jgi:hypothetical protein
MLYLKSVGIFFFTKINFLFFLSVAPLVDQLKDGLLPSHPLDFLIIRGGFRNPYPAW